MAVDDTHVVDVHAIGDREQPAFFHLHGIGLIVVIPIPDVLNPLLGQQIGRVERFRQAWPQPSERLFARGLLDGAEHLPDGLSFVLKREIGESLTIRDPMPHQLPSAFLHLLDGVGERLAHSGIQSHGGSHPERVQRVRDPPQPHPDAVVSPGVIDHIGDDVTGLRRIGHAGPGLEIPNFHVGNDPDRERLAIRPLERPSLQDERIFVAIGPAHGRALGLREEARTGTRGHDGAGGKPNALVEEFSAVHFQLLPSEDHGITDRRQKRSNPARLPLAAGRLCHTSKQCMPGESRPSCWGSGSAAACS